jgi:phage terminase Nu1 subunit (DNA packaging protein)
LSGEPLTSKEVCRKLGIKYSTLVGWRKEGLPCARDKGQHLFQAEEIAAWLLARGKAQPKESPQPTSPPSTIWPVHTKRAECAQYFGVNTRTLSSWLEDPSFPGRSGGRGSSARGYFPAREIAIWLRSNRKKARIPEDLATELGGSQPESATAVTPTARDRLVDVKTEQAMLELKKMQGRMIDAEEAAAFYQRTNSYAVTVLRQLPSRVLAALPSTIEEKTRTSIYETCQKVVSDCRSMIAELIEGDKDQLPGAFRGDA